MSNGHSNFSFFWDAFCITSIFGIWPRFIEPNLLKTTHVRLDFPETLKIVQISDLHFHSKMKQRFLQKVIRQVENERPDMIVITGDFLCNGVLSDSAQLKNFLMSFKAPLGVFAVLGNHDFNLGLNVNKDGDYDAVQSPPSPGISGIKRLLKKSVLTGQVTNAAKALYPHPELLELLKEASIVLLNNRTVQISGKMNLTGLGELMKGAASPESAFKDYDSDLPGIALVHNPDAAPLLRESQVSLILSGHTHGGQINLPWIWKRFTAMENPLYKSGLYSLKDKFLYISRGLGGVVPFRLNTIPEIVSFHLGSK